MGKNLQQRLIGALLLLTTIIAVAVFLVQNANNSLNPPVETIQPDFVSTIETDTIEVQSAEPEALLDPHQLESEPTKPIEPIKPQVQQSPVVEEKVVEKTVDLKVEKPIAVKPKPPVEVTTSGPQWVIQLASFSQQKNAQALEAKANKLGLKAHIEELSQNNKTTYRVRIGPESNRQTVDDIVKKISQTLSLKPQVLTLKDEN